MYIALLRRRARDGCRVSITCNQDPKMPISFEGYLLNVAYSRKYPTVIMEGAMQMFTCLRIAQRHYQWVSDQIKS